MVYLATLRSAWVVKKKKVNKKDWKPGVVVHAFKPALWEVEAGIMSTRPAKVT